MKRFLSVKTAKRSMVVMLALVVLVPVSVLAAGEFEDVPDDHTFVDDIAWMLANGITSGCGDGSNYCPDSSVTRGQMAAFMRRLSEKQVVDAGQLDGRNSTQFMNYEDTVPFFGTVYGVTGGGVTIAGDRADGAISFPVPMGTSLTPVILEIGETDENCPGTAIEPAADPGFLCIYVGVSVNMNTLSFYGLDDDGATSLASEYGGMLYGTSNNTPGRFQATWAATRPFTIIIFPFENREGVPGE